MLATPVCIVNFKSYANATGKNAVALAKQCEKAGIESGVQVIICVQTADISIISKSVKIPVFAQHIDHYEPGAHTGWVSAENVRENGALGTLLNHSEHKLCAEILKKSLGRAKHLGLLAVVCAENSEEAKIIAGLRPDAVAIEPPELIGGNISVSTAKPELVENTLRYVSSIPVLCGAGIKTKEDAAKAFRLGAKGILCSSGVVNSQNPYKYLKELLMAMK